MQRLKLNRELPRAIFLAAVGLTIFAATSARTSELTLEPDSDPNVGIARAAELEVSAANLKNGRDVFRFETFGNEGFWTDAAKLVEGIAAAKLTPVQALKTGLSVNVDALDPATQKAVADEIATKGTDGPLLNSFATTVKLLNANAVIGVVVRDTDGNGILDLTKGDKVGVSCVLCHAVTDKSVFNVPLGGSIGKQIDGPAAHTINIGGIFALASNTRAFYPMAQLKGADGKSIGRAPSSRGLTKNSSEREFDAYFANPRFYPAGMFDDTLDGNGNPMHNTPMFRADLSAPYGSAGELAKLDQFSNTVYTALFDPTTLVSSGGRAFLHAVAGAAGDKLANDYKEVLEETGVSGYPYVRYETRGKPGTPDFLVGIRVNNRKLLDASAYMRSLRSPRGIHLDPDAIERGRHVYHDKGNACLSCHGAVQSRAVPTKIVPMKMIFPGDDPKVLAVRTPPLSPLLDTPGNTFDDKMIVINASLRGLERGAALPLLMDLARKPVFLHDNSVASLNELFSSSRGAHAPHPFYVRSRERRDLVHYLKSLDDTDGWRR